MLCSNHAYSYIAKLYCKFFIILLCSYITCHFNTYRTQRGNMKSLICIVFTSVLLSQVTCITLAKIKLQKEAGNNEVDTYVQNQYV